MSKQLLIVFVKNFNLGKVKTRLAKTIGDKKALDIYKQLVSITQNAILDVNVDKHIYFSEHINEKLWGTNDLKFVQEGHHLGEKMLNAINRGFKQGYKHIILIGSDLPDISATIIQQAFTYLKVSDYVFGPATDGGYYLIGMKEHSAFIFKNKPWSTPQLLNTTLVEIEQKQKRYTLLLPFNDIDTYEDFKSSSIFNKNKV
ncbi:MAG TPA: glycosyltransferase [Crocinitomix sp.]|nr:glycosyltransferase [Crocinitomix sp.]